MFASRGPAVLLLLLLTSQAAAAWIAPLSLSVGKGVAVRRGASQPARETRGLPLSCSLSGETPSDEASLDVLRPPSPSSAAPTVSRRDLARGAAAGAVLAALSSTGLAQPASAAEDEPEPAKYTKTASGVQYSDILEGKGGALEAGCRVNFHFVGRLAGRNGKPFEDSTYDEPYRAVLGRGEMIEGLEEGMMGMKAGGSRRIVIPGELGYKDKRQGPIPREFGLRNRLYSTVLNTERTTREREALGADIAGVIVADVQVLKVFCDGIEYEQK
eukprot:CAMPEP_0173415514 /NCGR_PEP_ID=MMETSP1356-20130122/84897_1 /TAXON_ID=77927 ORGANISM="Hemiselmis virescens, Strain PCC157" /NCGR_SAMPLE_ID=MMETSP1356 /ASSEMBLY_ACC=CAM_ASM_000847 /LENGTH=271 /DNA_ID=CAMNT_0014377759 /DNA_START=69 /DNA_END=884 /DNA_ORIENTATION=-